MVDFRAMAIMSRCTKCGRYGESSYHTDSKGRLMHKYEIIIYWSNEDAAFVAEVPELPGCAAHCDTQQAALDNVNQAVELWIETAREFGDAVPEPKGARLMLA